MTDLTSEQRVMRAKIAADTRWAREPDRARATEPARRGLRAKLEREIDPDGTMPPAEVERRVDSLMRAHVTRMSLAASKARRAKARRPVEPTSSDAA